MTEIWEDDDRTRPRGHYVIPCLLHDTATSVSLKAVLLDLSAEGCRVFTNDRRATLMDARKLVGKTFRLEFDFYDVEVGNVVGTVTNVHPGKDPQYERQLGIHFEAIDPDVARKLNRLVMRDREAAG